VVRIMNVLGMAECSPVSSLGYGNLTKLYLEYAYVKYKLKTDLQCCMVAKKLRCVLYGYAGSQ